MLRFGAPFRRPRLPVLLFLACVYLVRDGEANHTRPDPVPIVLWHGMGDSCCFSFSMGQIKKILEEHIPGVYVKSIKIGDNLIEDVENSYFKNVNEQVQQVCEELANDVDLQNGFNAIGFSQGGQFLRAVAQRCGKPRMLNLISLGGQHQGVYGLPNCASLEHKLCNYLRRVLRYFAYNNYIQKHLVQAEYWHDPLNEDIYREKSIFLADINNERYINKTYIKNLQKLKNFVLVKFEKDTMVQPIITEWFGYYKPGQADETEELENSKLYREGQLGLDDLLKSGRLHFLSVNANHLQFTDEWFIKNIINSFLKN